MKGLKNNLARRFYEICEDVKNSQNEKDLIFNFGVACGFTSALMLADVIDMDCYTAMYEYIREVRYGYHSTK